MLFKSHCSLALVVYDNAEDVENMINTEKQSFTVRGDQLRLWYIDEKTRGTTILLLLHIRTFLLIN